MADGDFEGNKLGIFDGHTLGEANRDLLGMTDGDFKGSISHQDAVETLSSSCMLDDLSCGKMHHSEHNCTYRAVTFTTTQQSMTRLLEGAQIAPPARTIRPALAHGTY